MIRAQRRRAARNFATSWKKWLCALKKNESRSPNSSGESPASTAASAYAMPFASVNASSCTAVERIGRDAGAADLAVGARVVGVVAELRRQVERDGEAGLPVVEQVPVARVRLLRRR